MAEDRDKKRPWRDALRAWLHPRIATMLLLGFSAGLPLLLIFSTLSVWLREAGVSRSAVTFFSWAALGYSFKFTWAPIVDRMPLPFLTRRLGRRRSWLLLSQFSVTAAICWMALVDPGGSTRGLTVMALAAVLLGFSSATQDIVIDAFRIECAGPTMQGMLSAAYIAGYRVGMLTAGAGSLFLASYLGTTGGFYLYPAWRTTYLAVASCMLPGILTTLCVSEPDPEGRPHITPRATADYLRFAVLFLAACGGFALTFFAGGALWHPAWEHLAVAFPHAGRLLGFLAEAFRLGIAVLAAWFVARLLVSAGLVESRMVEETYIAPARDFFRRYGMKTAVLILGLVGLYRISDIVLGVVSNVFYLDMGFSKNQIAAITKTFGLVMTIAGGFLGGMFTLRFGILRILFAGAVLASGTNLLFMILARLGPDIGWLTAVIAADNLAAGLASAGFVAFLSSLTSVSFTAVQYAVFSSLMSLFPKLLGGYSGTIVTSIGYPAFFLLTTALGLPVLLLILLIRKDMELSPNPGRPDHA